MKFFLSLICILLINYSSLAATYPEGPSYRIMRNEIDRAVPRHKGKVTFLVKSAITDENPSLRYGDNGWEKTIKLDDSKDFAFIVRPGQHQFMIFLNDQYREIITDSILIEAQHHVEIALFFKPLHGNQLVKKPVIYLYPSSIIDVEVKLKPTGKLTYTYPKYENLWRVQAAPDGTLNVGKDTYNYLFWEAEQNLSLLQPLSAGRFIRKEDAEIYIDKVLSDFGLNSFEKADFMTFWIPQMLSTKEEILYISFLFNDACKRFAELEVVPQPDAIGRVYMLWKPVTEVQAIIDSKELPVIPTVQRSGFTLIEWGGVQLEIDN